MPRARRRGRLCARRRGRLGGDHEISPDDASFVDADVEANRIAGDFLRAGIEEDLYSERTVVRLTRMLCADNAKRAYQLGGPFL